MTTYTETLAEVARRVIREHRVKSEVGGARGHVVTYRCTGCDYVFVRDMSAGGPAIDWLADHVSYAIALAARIEQARADQLTDDDRRDLAAVYGYEAGHADGLAEARAGEAALRERVYTFAQSRAIGSHARSDQKSERDWLDLLHLLDRAALDGDA